MGHLVIVWCLPHLAHATICMHGKKIRFLLSSTQMVHRDVFSTLSSSCFVYFPFSTIFFCRSEIVFSFCFKSRHFSCITFALCWRLCIISLCILKTTSLSNCRWQIMQYNFWWMNSLCLLSGINSKKSKLLSWSISPLWLYIAIHSPSLLNTRPAVFFIIGNMAAFW